MKPTLGRIVHVRGPGPHGSKILDPDQWDAAIVTRVHYDGITFEVCRFAEVEYSSMGGPGVWTATKIVPETFNRAQEITDPFSSLCGWRWPPRE